jgi:HD-GYP domain-containing protein (c-di-GMP phosphodiesterase class II)
MFSLLQSKSIVYTLVINIKLSILNGIAMIPFAIILALLFKQYTYLGVVFFIFPIMLARYTFSLYINSKSQYTDTVDALMRAMEARDKYTEGHAQRVAELVKEIAKELKYNDWTIDKLNIASLLHDVGKIGIDDCILNKPGKLTDEEYDIIKSHPEIGYGILKDVKNLKDIIHIVKHHHERYDGKGYPDGMSGDELNLDVYIVQLADCVDAMTTDRPYRKALTLEQVISELENNSGTQFHPKVVDAYLNLQKKKNENIQG